MTVFKRAFFGKTSCLKVMFNQGSIYIHMGLKGPDGWTWDKLKFNDMEAGEIVRVLNGRKNEVSFYHKFDNHANKAWVTRKDDGAFFFRINDVNKNLSDGEQEVLRVLLEKFILLSSKQEAPDA